MRVTCRIRRIFDKILSMSSYSISKLFPAVSLTILVSGSFSAFAEKQPLDRYQSIIDRQMFGVPPPGFDPTNMPSEVQKSKSDKELSKEQEKLKSAVHFSAINVTGEGEVEVGFTDNSDPKNPHHYFLKVGQTCAGWKVEKADAETATMTIVKDGIALELALGDNSATGGGTIQRVGATDGAPAVAARSTSSPDGRRLSHRERLRERERQRNEEDAARRQREREEREAERKADREEMQSQLQSIMEETKRSREVNAELEKIRIEAERMKAEAEKSKAEAEKAKAEAEAAKAEKGNGDDTDKAE